MGAISVPCRCITLKRAARRHYTFSPTGRLQLGVYSVAFLHVRAFDNVAVYCSRPDFLLKRFQASQEVRGSWHPACRRTTFAQTTGSFADRQGERDQAAAKSTCLTDDSLQPCKHVLLACALPQVGLGHGRDNESYGKAIESWSSMVSGDVYVRLREAGGRPNEHDQLALHDRRRFQAMRGPIPRGRKRSVNFMR